MCLEDIEKYEKKHKIGYKLFERKSKGLVTFFVGQLVSEKGWNKPTMSPEIIEKGGWNFNNRHTNMFTVFRTKRDAIWYKEYWFPYKDDAEIWKVECKNVRYKGVFRKPCILCEEIRLIERID